MPIGAEKLLPGRSRARSGRALRLEALPKSLTGQRGDRPPAARRERLPAETLPEIVQHPRSDLCMMFRDVLAPKRLLDLSIVDRPDIQQGQLGLAAKSVAGEDVGEDGGTIDQTMLQAL